MIIGKRHIPVGSETIALVSGISKPWVTVVAYAYSHRYPLFGRVLETIVGSAYCSCHPAVLRTSAEVIPLHALDTSARAGGAVRRRERRATFVSCLRVPVYANRRTSAGHFICVDPAIGDPQPMDRLASEVRIAVEAVTGGLVSGAGGGPRRVLWSFPP